MHNSPLSLVTGAGGFVGGKIVERLLAEGRRVRAFSRRPLPELEARGVEIARGELSDSPSLHAACAGVETIFHVAARVGVWGPAKEFHAVNVDGTARLLEAAITHRVRRFIHTSSPSVVYTGGDLRGVDESARLCTRAPCAYPTSKALAERLVRAVHCPDLRTVALRPHLVWGPGDRHLVPRVVAAARRGRLRVVGRGENRVDLTHIDNVVDAHLLAERALGTADSPASGRAYFVTNGEPVALWPWINDLLQRLGLPPLRRRIPVGAAAAMGSLCESLWRILPLRGEPPMTAFAAHELATDHWFSIAAARRDLGYEPRVTMTAGLDEYLPLLRAELGL
ncbi:MAG: NAD-dependent epimerase/dehydratase family protein [Opitutaceae bacterium]